MNGDPLDWWNDNQWWLLPLIGTVVTVFVLPTLRAYVRRTQVQWDDQLLDAAEEAWHRSHLDRWSLIEPSPRADSLIKPPGSKTWKSDRTEDDVRREHEEHVRNGD